MLCWIFNSRSLNSDQIDIRAFALASCPITVAMDPSQQQMHHQLTRALVHLNQLAGFFPFFQPNTDWEPAPSSLTSANPMSTSRHLHTFVPLPSSLSSASLATHGGHTSSIRVEPYKPHFRAISTAEMPPPPSMIHRPHGTGTIHPACSFTGVVRAPYDLRIAYHPSTSIFVGTSRHSFVQTSTHRHDDGNTSSVWRGHRQSFTSCHTNSIWTSWTCSQASSCRYGGQWGFGLWSAHTSAFQSCPADRNSGRYSQTPREKSQLQLLLLIGWIPWTVLWRPRACQLQTWQQSPSIMEDNWTKNGSHSWKLSCSLAMAQKYTIRAHHQEQHNRAGRLSAFVDSDEFSCLLDRATVHGLPIYNATSAAKKTASACLS